MAYIYTSQIILKGNQGWSSNQELEGRTKLEFTGEYSFSMAFSNACSAYFFFFFFFFFFFNTTEDFVPGMYQPLKSGLFYFHINKIKKKKSPYSCPEASFIEAFPPVRIFPGVLSLCHIGKKKKKEKKRKKKKKSKQNN